MLRITGVGPASTIGFSTIPLRLVSFKESLIPSLRTQFMSRIDLRKAFKQLFRDVSQMYLLGTVVGDFVFIDATMSMGLRSFSKRTS